MKYSYFMLLWLVFWGSGGMIGGEMLATGGGGGEERWVHVRTNPANYEEKRNAK